MDNNDILARFHLMNYEERVYLTTHQDHFQNSAVTPLAQQVNRAVAKVADSAQEILCQYEVLQNTPLCTNGNI